MNFIDVGGLEELINATNINISWLITATQAAALGFLTGVFGTSSINYLTNPKCSLRYNKSRRHFLKLGVGATSYALLARPDAGLLFSVHSYSNPDKREPAKVPQESETQHGADNTSHKPETNTIDSSMQDFQSGTTFGDNINFSGYLAINEGINPQIDISTSERSLLERVLFKEATPYVPPTANMPTHSVEDYDNAYLQSIINIINVIDNRRKNEKYFPNQNSFWEVLTENKDFNAIWEEENKAFFFSENDPAGKVLNTNPISEADLMRVYGIKNSDIAGSKNLMLEHGKKKLELIRKAIDLYMSGDVHNLVKQGLLQSLFDQNVIFYKNSSKAHGEKWHNKCWTYNGKPMYVTQYVREDQLLIPEFERHQFYKANDDPKLISSIC